MAEQRAAAVRREDRADVADERGSCGCAMILSLRCRVTDIAGCREGEGSVRRIGLTLGRRILAWGS